MLASVLARMVAGALLHDGLMTEKLTRRGLFVQSDYHADPLAGTRVTDVMSTTVETLPSTASVGDARRRFEVGRHSAYPLVDAAGRCVGIVSRGDLLRADGSAAGPLRDVSSNDVVGVSPGESVQHALHLMLEEQLEHIPVIDVDGRLLGICTRTDGLAVRRRHVELEGPQRGWAPWFRGETDDTTGSAW